MWTILAVLFTHFFIPGTLLFMQARRPYRHRIEWILMQLLMAAFAILYFYAGLWYWFAVWLRWVLLGLFLFNVAMTARRLPELPWWRKGTPRDAFGYIMIGAMTLLVGGLALWAWAGQDVERARVADLNWPLPAGRYCVAEGGDAHIINSMHAYPDIPRKFTVDLVGLYATGQRARGLYPDDPAAYAIADRVVLAPLDGVVETALDSFPDVVGGNPDTSFSAYLGNRVAIAAGDIVVTLAFLKAGSVRVSAGDTVAAGDTLARVGCSGDAHEPTLRLFAWENRDNPPWGWGVGIPIRLAGVFPTRNRTMVVP